MTKKIAVFPRIRAECGLLSLILQAIDAYDGLTLQLIVGGAHLDAAFGKTRDEIITDGFEIAAEVSGDTTDTAREIG